MSEIDRVLGDTRRFLTSIFSGLSERNVDVSTYELDHLCYRVGSEAEYALQKHRLSDLGRMLCETMVGGRPIATFRLFVPVTFEHRRIYVVELPSPKPGSAYPSGLEHVEFVIGESFPEFMARYPNLEFETDGMGKKHNAELRLSLGELSVKFHHQALEQVIAAEKAHQ